MTVVGQQETDGCALAIESQKQASYPSTTAQIERLAPFSSRPYDLALFDFSLDFSSPSADRTFGAA
jgi:hypothetical protein